MTVPMKKYTYDGGKLENYPSIYSGAITCSDAGGAAVLSTASQAGERGCGVTWSWFGTPYRLAPCCPLASMHRVGKPSVMSTECHRTQNGRLVAGKDS